MRWIVVVTVVAVVLAVIFRMSRTGGGVDARSRRVLATRGAARCLEATRLLQYLAKRDFTPDTVAAWGRIELVLVESLPDCPPALKNELRTALETCSRGCSHRETAKALMVVRDAILP
jgi:hypothetical protein